MERTLPYYSIMSYSLILKSEKKKDLKNKVKRSKRMCDSWYV